jgi:hypothetical protein
MNEWSQSQKWLVKNIAPSTKGRPILAISAAAAVSGAHYIAAPIRIRPDGFSITRENAYLTRKMHAIGVLLKIEPSARH